MRMASSISSQQEFLCTVTIAPVQKSRSAQFTCINADVFNTVHCKRHRFLAFFKCILSKTYRNEYRMNKNAIPVLISMPVNQYNDKPCTGAEV